MKSSINLLLANVLLLFFVSPLHSNPQRTYWSNYWDYYPRFQSGNPIVFPDRYSVSSIQKPPTYTPQIEETPAVTYELNYFQQPPSSLGYPDEVPERKYLGDTIYYDYPDFLPTSQEQELKNEQKTYRQVENTESDVNEKEIIEKMHILDRLLSDEIEDKDLDTNAIEEKIMPEETKRVARQIRNQKPGFFWTLARVTFEAFNDTKSAIKQIGDIITNTIVPDSATQSSMRSGSLTAAGATPAPGNTTSVNMTVTATPSTTTTQRSVLTVSAVQSLIRRNVLGLVRLFNIEWRDALNQSDINVREFRKDLGNQVGSYLRDNPNAY